MANAWGGSWGSSWGSSWGQAVAEAAPTAGLGWGGFDIHSPPMPLRTKRRRELLDGPAAITETKTTIAPRVIIQDDEEELAVLLMWTLH